jgi:hypothetical protein
MGDAQLAGQRIVLYLIGKALYLAQGTDALELAWRR